MKLDPEHPIATHMGVNLPHVDSPNMIQFITYRLGDSIPQNLLKRLEIILKSVPAGLIDSVRRKKLQFWLDQGKGECLLNNKRIAKIIADDWIINQRNDYKLLAWVIMPNHVHLLVRIYKELPLSSIIQRRKGYTAMIINKILNRTDRVWMPDYFDRFIRDKAHFRYTLKYIKQNIEHGGVLWYFPEFLVKKYLGEDDKN